MFKYIHYLYTTVETRNRISPAVKVWTLWVKYARAYPPNESWEYIHEVSISLMRGINIMLLDKTTVRT